VRRRPLTAALLLAGLAVGMPAGASAGTSGSYHLNVLPDPTQGASPYSSCRPTDGTTVVDRPVGVAAWELALPAAGTLRADLVEKLDAFAGDVGLRWSLRVFDTTGHELARSTGPAYRTDLSWRSARATRVWLVACNTHGHPEATLTYSFR